MLIYPTIKQAPLSGLSGFGGGATALPYAGGGVAFAAGDAGKAASEYFWRPGDSSNDGGTAIKGGFDLTLTDDNGNSVAETGPDAAGMPPGMTWSRQMPANSYYQSENDESFTWAPNMHFWAYIYPTAATNMRKPVRQYKTSNMDYTVFVTDAYSSNARYDWASNNNYNSRASENVQWGSGGTNNMLDNTWNYIEFGMDSSNVVFTCQTWDGSSWSNRFNLSHSGGSTINGAGAGQTDAFRVFEGFTGYLGNFGYDDGSGPDLTDPASS